MTPGTPGVGWDLGGGGRRRHRRTCVRGEKCGDEYLSQSDSDGEASGQDGNWGGVEGRKWPRQREEAGAEDEEVVEEVEGDWESCTTSTDHPLNIQAAHMEGEGDERRMSVSACCALEFFLSPTSGWKIERRRADGRYPLWNVTRR